jgi:glucose-6-phosphate isomerase
MIDLKLDIEGVKNFVSPENINAFQSEIDMHHRSLLLRTGRGNDFLGWLDTPSLTEEGLLRKIRGDAEMIQGMAEIFVVIGIGGSYLGARAVTEALGPNFQGLTDGGDQKYPRVIFAGNNISEDYLAELLTILDKKDYALAVISKSGTTTEPAIAFRILRTHIEQKYGKESARKRIIAITDKSRGALKKLATDEGYTTYDIPDDVGGRYSALTPVGLMPIAVAGFDITQLIEGARKMEESFASTSSLENNPAALYAVTRNALYRSGKPVEIMVNYLPNLNYITEWWKQLFGESDGKQNRGIFPAGVTFTSDLHSMGQYIQEGLRVIFETVLLIDKSKHELRIPLDKDDLDGLNFIAGKRLGEVNLIASQGTTLAHIDGGVPNIKITLPVLNENTLGQLIYFFEAACALSGYLLEVNPFDQPGVEAYKKNMFALLGKPGFEAESAILRQRLGLE